MVTDQTNVIRYVYSQALTSYLIPFPYTDRTHIKVIGSYSDSTEVELSQNIDYTISIPSSSGKIVILNPSSFEFTRLTIIRELPITQETDYKNGEPLDADIVENSFDRQTMQMQQMNEALSRTIKTTVTEEGNDFVMPGVEERKSGALGFDDTGKKFKVYPNPGVGAERAEAAAIEAEKNAQKVEELAERMWAYSTKIGNGRDKEYIVSHNLDNNDIIAQLWAENTDYLTFYTMDKIDENNLKLTFEEIIPIDAIQIVISCMGEPSNNKVQWGNVENVEITYDQIKDGTVYSQEEIDEKYQTMTPADIENIIGA